MTTTITAPTLFGWAPDGTIVPPVAPYRRTDPFTSSEVAQDRKLRVKFNSERHLLLSAFAVYAAHDELGMTDEAAAALVFDREAVRIESIEATRRCSDLRRDGFIEWTGERRKKASGNLAGCSRVTRAGREHLAIIRQHRRGDRAA